MNITNNVHGINMLEEYWYVSYIIHYNNNVHTIKHINKCIIKMNKHISDSYKTIMFIILILLNIFYIIHHIYIIIIIRGVIDKRWGICSVTLFYILKIIKIRSVILLYINSLYILYRMRWYKVIGYKNSYAKSKNEWSCLTIYSQ